MSRRMVLCEGPDDVAALREIAMGIFGAITPRPGVGELRTRQVAALFDPDDVPRYSTASRFPVDVQNCAQAIQTLSRLAWIDPGALEHAERVTQAVVHQLWIPVAQAGIDQGWFAAWRGPRGVNRVPLVRWGQAPMVLALESLLAARAGLRPSWERA